MSDFPIENRTYILDQTCIQESGEPDKKDGVFRWADRDRVYKIAKDGFCDTTRPLNPYSREVKDLLEKLKRDSLDHLPLSAAENYLKAFSLAETSFKQKNIDSAEAFLNIASSISVQSGITFNYERAFPILKEYPDKVVIDQICVKGQNFEGGRNGLFHFYEDNLYKTDREGRCDLFSPLSLQSAEVQGVLKKLKRSSLEDLPLYRARDYFLYFRKAEEELEKRNLDKATLALERVLEIALKGGVSLDYEKFDKIFRRIHEVVLDRVCIRDGGFNQISDDTFFVRSDEVYALNQAGWCDLNHPLVIYPKSNLPRSPEITELLKKLKKISLEGLQLSQAKKYLDAFQKAEESLKNEEYEKVYGYLLQARQAAQFGNIQFDSQREKKILEGMSVKAWLLNSIFLLQAVDQYTIRPLNKKEGTLKVLAFPTASEKELQEKRRGERTLFLKGSRFVSRLLKPSRDIPPSYSDSLLLRNQILGILSYFKKPVIPVLKREKEQFLPKTSDGILTLDHYLLSDERGAFMDSPEYISFISFSREEFLLSTPLSEFLGDFLVELDPAYHPRDRRIALQLTGEKIDEMDVGAIKKKILQKLESAIQESRRTLSIQGKKEWSKTDYLKGLKALIEFSH